MKDTIKKIFYSTTFMGIVLIIVTVYLIISFSNFNLQNNKKNTSLGINSRKIDINILNDKILCEDEIDFSLFSENKLLYRFFSYEENAYLSNVDLELVNSNYIVSSAYVKMDLSIGRIYFNDVQLKELVTPDHKLKVKLTYEIDKDYIKRYTDTDVLTFDISWDNLSYLKDLEVNITSNESISDLGVDNSMSNYIVNQDKNNIYCKRIKENGELNILFNINSKTSNVINSEYIEEKTILEKNEKLENQNKKAKKDSMYKSLYSYVYDNRYFLIFISIISTILFILSIVINKKQKIKTLKRDLVGLAPPVMAEAIIDGKIGLKEMLMTTIIHLHNKGNIKIVNNEVLELVSTNNLEDYEKYVTELLFENPVIKINDINNIFSQSNIETVEFAEKIGEIKNSIQEKIFEMNLFSRLLTKVNKIVTIISLLIAFNIPTYLLNDSMRFAMFWINIIFIKYYIKGVQNKRTMRVEMLRQKTTHSISRSHSGIIIIFLLTIVISVRIAIYYPLIFASVMLIAVLNFYVAYKSNRAVLTTKGKKEQAKLLELKNFMNEFTLMKKRDLESVVIWDEYLAYATAFGIPSKITNSIYEKWFNLNLNLQIIDIYL